MTSALYRMRVHCGFSLHCGLLSALFRCYCWHVNPIVMRYTQNNYEETWQCAVCVVTRIISHSQRGVCNYLVSHCCFGVSRPIVTWRTRVLCSSRLKSLSLLSLLSILRGCILSGILFSLTQGYFTSRRVITKVSTQGLYYWVILSGSKNPSC